MHDRVYRPAVAQRSKSANRARYDASCNTSTARLISCVFERQCRLSARSVCIGQAAFRLDDGNGLTGRDQDVCARGCALARRAKAGPSEQTLFSQSRGGFCFVISNLAPPDPFHLLLAISSGRAARCTRARTAGAKRHDIGGGCDGVGAWLRGGGGGSSAARKRRGGPTHAR